MNSKDLEALWKTRISEYKSSGLTQTEWCRRHNVSHRQLSYWLRKEKSIKSTTQWLPVQLSHQEETRPENYINIKMGKAEIEIKQDVSTEFLSKILAAVKNIC
jgi:hypothetical protein